MSLEEQLQTFILERYKTMMAFSRESGIPYTTLKGIISRGIAGASVQVVIKICNALNIDVDALIDGVIICKPKPLPELTPHIQRLICAYVDQPDMQKSVDRLLQIENLKEKE